MADTPDLNPKPVPGPAEVNSKPAKLNKADEPNPAPKSTWVGAFDAIGAIFEQIKKNPEPAYLFVAVYAILAVLDVLNNGYTSPMNTSSSNLETLALFIFLLSLPVYALALADRKPITIAEFMNFDLGRYLTLLGVSILTLFLFTGAALLLVVPLIWVVPWFMMGSYVAVDRKLGVIDSLKESKRLTQDHKGKVWGVIGASLLLALAVAVLSFIPVVGSAASAAITLLSSGALALLYRWLQKNVPASL